jgi:hypothetical protein
MPSVGRPPKAPRSGPGRPRGGGRAGNVSLTSRASAPAGPLRYAPGLCSCGWCHSGALVLVDAPKERGAVNFQAFPSCRVMAGSMDVDRQDGRERPEKSRCVRVWSCDLVLIRQLSVGVVASSSSSFGRSMVDLSCWDPSHILMSRY